MNIMRRKAGDQLNEFAKSHLGMAGGIIGVVCVNGKVQSFVQEFPQTLVPDSFHDVMNGLRDGLLAKIYDRRIISVG